MFFKGITKVFNSLGNASASLAELVEESVELGKDNIQNSREITAQEHLVELTKVTKKVSENDVKDAMLKMKLLREARKEAKVAQGDDRE